MKSKAIARSLTALAICACLPATAAEVEECDDGPDSELQSTYEFLLSTSEGSRKALLDQAQRAWLEYRDASCELFSERPGNRALAAAAFDDCMTFMARERTLELRILSRAAAGQP